MRQVKIMFAYFWWVSRGLIFVYLAFSYYHLFSNNNTSHPCCGNMKLSVLTTLPLVISGQKPANTMWRRTRLGPYLHCTRTSHQDFH